ncbi:HAMP domain-containing sensor histidine kinase [Paenibacillus dokdonensis]|uniref:histidine kinase n=2 Tax=Paenibacillus dokdonensis TaxID=2567944 RepID=A0ABU6GN44_9BACL|nr:HAMP domain-containing sensor histidine kinase [Paenibacillus dokdonensis]MEC0241176.1 HAMP domain-containing sensor histidine kinase [Paenibacillus dokdonensis]
MKLVHQINLAFGIALVLVLSVTGIIIHYVLLDHLIGAQKNDLKAMSAEMTATMQQGYTAMSSVAVKDYALAVPIAPSNLSVNAILTDSTGSILSVSPSTPYSISSFTSVGTNNMAKLQTATVKSIQNGTAKDFITVDNVTPQGKLTLYTPLSKINTIEQALLKRLLIIFSTAGLVMLILSLFITKKFIEPLIQLRDELNKVKERRFADVSFVKAGGEIGSVAKSVFDMAGELNRFNHVQKQFFQNASHELKTPLMSISGYAEGIRDGVFEGEGVRKGLDVIMSESARLKKLVTEMTLLAKLDSEEDVFKTEEICLQDLLTETVERMNPLLVKKGITLHTMYADIEPVKLRADRDKLLQALLNVVSNAVRYAKHHIYIHAEIQNMHIVIRISDDGPGISETLLPYLFHRFVKGKDGESGLGLAISRAIVERSGGLIQAGNERGGGAVISLDFPAVPET